MRFWDYLLKVKGVWRPLRSARLMKQLQVYLRLTWPWFTRALRDFSPNARFNWVSLLRDRLNCNTGMSKRDVK